MKKYIWVPIVVLMVVGAFYAQDAMANDAAEDKIVGIIERILNVIADFFERIFQSIAEAIKSIFTGGEDAKKY
tara:strand:+ start:137227 stop:137445 length:219 start_codon:yes stop_codon:yes gene_type:complete